MVSTAWCLQYGQVRTDWSCVFAIGSPESPFFHFAFNNPGSLAIHSNAPRLIEGSTLFKKPEERGDGVLNFAQADPLKLPCCKDECEDHCHIDSDLQKKMPKAPAAM
jgi:hypothetical protein